MTDFYGWTAADLGVSEQRFREARLAYWRDQHPIYASVVRDLGSPQRGGSLPYLPREVTWQICAQVARGIGNLPRLKP